MEDKGTISTKKRKKERKRKKKEKIIHKIKEGLFPNKLKPFFHEELQQKLHHVYEKEHQNLKHDKKFNFNFFKFSKIIT